MVDYATSFLNILHLMTANVQSKVSGLITFSEILMFLLLNPIAPAISCLLWMIFRILENKKMIQHYNFLSRLSCLINGTFESPAQMVLVLFFFITGRLQLPWNRETEIQEDVFGNKINLGYQLSIISFVFCWISLVKTASDSYQCNKVMDTITVITFIIIQVLFRIFTYTAMVTQVLYYVALPISMIFLLNIFIGSIWKPGQSGINLTTTALASIFCVVGMPEDPSVKPPEMDANRLKTLKSLVLSTASITLPFLIAFSWLTYFLPALGMKVNINIPFTKEQQFFMMTFIYSGLIVLYITSCLTFAWIFNNKSVNNCVQCILNILMFGITIGFIVFSILLFPPFPSVVIVTVEQDNGGSQLFEGFTYQESLPPEGASCTLTYSTLTCGNSSFIVEFVLNQRDLNLEDKRLVIIDQNPQAMNITNVLAGNGSKVNMFTMFSQQMISYLNDNSCKSKCNHERSNRCKNLLFTADRSNKCRLKTAEALEKEKAKQHKKNRILERTWFNEGIFG